MPESMPESMPGSRSERNQDDVPEHRWYRRLRAERPELFANPVDGLIEIVSDEAAVAGLERDCRERAEPGRPESWDRTGVLYQDRYLSLVRDPVRFPDGRLAPYIRLVPRQVGGVAVLPRCGQDVVLLRHFRHATRSWHLEIPRGFTEPGEEPAQAARRELTEEIGVEPRTLERLGAFHPDTGVSADRVHLFLATIDAPGEPQVAEGIASTLRVPWARLEAMIGAGEITDSFTIAAAYRLALRAG
jgi:ADP-ribose pyrophosphatase